MAKLNAVQLLRLKDPSLTKDSAAALVSCRNVYVDGELCTDPKQNLGLGMTDYSVLKNSIRVPGNKEENNEA